ncbi:MAG: CRISPR-associated protein Cas5 [Clostridia bacterium]|nr:CRISPR-associated protein Cas5 [Clostridia bacterium]
MVVLVFELRGKMAHFRRPDTSVTHATYPFISRTALLGMMASVLGKPSLEGENVVGIELLSPPATVVQEMSLLGKGWMGEPKSTFSRPTSVEFVVNPHYRVYYSGQHAGKLAGMMAAGQSVYHTYLGSAFCPTVPDSPVIDEFREIPLATVDELSCRTVLPSYVVDRLIPESGARYGRVGGMLHQCVDPDQRRFRGAVNLVYEASGKPIRFMPVANTERAQGLCSIVRLHDGTVAALW